MATRSQAKEHGQVLTTDELVRAADAVNTLDVVAPDLVTLERAAQALFALFGPLVGADYLDGKTAFRDALVNRFGLSELAAEQMCDELERVDRIHFVRTEDEFAWRVEPEAAQD